ncbi:MAG: ATP-binding protein [Elainellaceae cyanobacterium]
MRSTISGARELLENSSKASIIAEKYVYGFKGMFMDLNYLCSLLEEMVALPHETECVEFKVNNTDSQEIGEYISAIANSAALHSKQTGYVVWGVKDENHEIVGTNFNPRQQKVGAQNLENWISTQLSPRIDFKIFEFDYFGNSIVLLEIPRATYIPVKFKSIEYIRVGSYKKKLVEHPEKERTLWSIFSNYSFEEGVALENVPA